MPEPSRADVLKPARAHAAAPAVLAFVVALHPIVTADFWWHLASGRWILENRRFPSTDVFTYTVPDHDWVNLQWLTDVSLAGLWGWIGPDGLVLLKSLDFALLALLLYALARAAGASAAPAGVAASLAILAGAERTMLRPEIATFLGLALFLYVLEREDRRSLLLLPPITAIWANLHSLAFLGPLVVLLHGALDLVERRPAARSKLIVGGVCALAALLNPFGVRFWSFPLALFRRIEGGDETFRRILEFAPPTEDPGDPALRFFWLALAVFAISSAMLFRSGWRRVVAVLPLLLLALLARRNVPLFAVAAVPVTALGLAEVGRRLPSALRRSELSWTLPALVVGLAGTLLAGESPRLLGLWRDRGLGTAPGNGPEECLAALEESGRDGNLFNDLDFGGYVSWRSPHRPTFIDARLEVMGSDWLRRYAEAHESPIAWRRMRSSWDLRVLLLEHSSPGSAAFLLHLLNEDGWWPLRLTPDAALLVPESEGLPVAARPVAADWDEVLATDRGPAPGAGRGLALLTDPIHRVVGPAVPRAAIRRATRWANLCLTLGWFSEAIDGYEAVLGVSPTDTEALLNRGICELRLGREAAARRHWTEALDVVERSGRSQIEDALRRIDAR